MNDKQITEFQGKCLCGAVVVHMRHSRPSMSVCHCNFCRRWAGGPFMTVECHDAPRIEGLEQVRIYPSSDWAERGFCTQCGTHLFYRLRDAEFYALPVGLFDKGGDWPFELQVFVDQKPGNYQFSNTTQEITGEDVFKAWSSS